MKNRSAGKCFLIGVLVFCLILLAGCTTSENPNEGPASVPGEDPVLEGPYPVVRVVDGDTIVVRVRRENEKIRLIGIDTPEAVHPDPSRNIPYGQVASDYTKKMLEGREVYLEFDVSHRDKYGRLLAYVYLDGRMFNEMLLEEGHARAGTYPPNVKYEDRFYQLQKKARKDKRGGWASDAFD
ncbi:MAG: thermonuclease family protein [Anaerovoracaceae bacterium]